MLYIVCSDRNPFMTLYVVIYMYLTDRDGGEGRARGCSSCEKNYGGLSPSKIICSCDGEPSLIASFEIL